jgi:hypothetical protein
VVFNNLAEERTYPKHWFWYSCDWSTHMDLGKNSAF